MAPVSSMPFPCRGHAVPHGPRGPHPPKGGGISGVARDVATCAAEAVCVRGGPSGGRGGRGPTGSDITPVPLSPPTPLKNPEPVSLPPSRHPPLLLPVEADSTHNGHSTPFPRHVPFNPSFPSPLLRAQKLRPCAYPRSWQVGSRLRSRDRSIESLEYKEQREASVEYKAAGAGLALQLEKAPGRKPGESARRGVGGGWKVRLGREVCTVRKFPPSSQSRRVSGENYLPSRWGKVICA